jgi:O-antigen/teichoic acid export membrane protein
MSAARLDGADRVPEVVGPDPQALDLASPAASSWYVAVQRALANILQRSSIRASAWVLVGNAAGYALRLGGSLILTRLLFREAFGVMALVNAVLQGLVMMTDLGIGPNIIQSKRGDDREFLSTAWTIQAARGAALLLASFLLAWPGALFFKLPQLVYFIPMMGLNAFIGGLSATSLYTLTRSLNQKRLVLLDVFVQSTTLIVTVVWARIWPSAWALIGGATIACLLKTVISHLIGHGHRDRLRWDSDAAAEVIRFGRWIFLSSILTFGASRLDAFILARALDIAELGTYSIAMNIARLPVELMSAVAGAVMFPVVAQAFRRDRRGVPAVLFRARAAMVVPVTILYVGIAIGGDRLVGLLYDARYRDAGWMLQVLAAGQIGVAISLSSGAAFLAGGKTFTHMCLEGFRLAMLIGGMAVGHALWNKQGLIIGVAANGLLVYPAWAVALAREKLWQPRLDLPILFTSGLALAGLVFLH